MAGPASSADVWIATDPSSQPDAATQTTIRRHVMRNKNTREQQQVARIRDLMLQYENHWQQQQATRAIGFHPADEKDWIPKLPRQVATELAAFDFGVELRPYMVDLIFKGRPQTDTLSLKLPGAFAVIKPMTYTVEKTLVGEAQHQQQDNLFCFSNLARHPAMTHAIIHTSQTFFDVSSGIDERSGIASYHLGEALRHLQLALGDGGDVAHANSTMAVVVALATAAAVLGDIDGVGVHLNGLQQMVNARGGLDSLGQGSMLEHKAQRLDFILSLATGAPTRFFRPVPWGPHIALDGATQCPELKTLQPRPDERLMNIWADLREFSRVANQATRSGTKMSTGFFCRLADTVPWRLTALRFDPASVSEMLRLCMLAYTRSMLTQIPGVGRHLSYLHQTLKPALIAHARRAMAMGPEAARFLLWAVFVAAMTVFQDFDREWVRELAVVSAGNSGVVDWGAARAVFGGFLWTDLVHHREGEQLFNQWLGKGAAS